MRWPTSSIPTLIGPILDLNPLERARALRRRTDGRPIAPVAPAIRILIALPSQLALRRLKGGALVHIASSSWGSLALLRWPLVYVRQAACWLSSPAAKARRPPSRQV